MKHCKCAEEFSDSHLSAFVADVCESKRMLAELVEYLRNTVNAAVPSLTKMSGSVDFIESCKAFLLFLSIVLV